jgi:hypothetical protein
MEEIIDGTNPLILDTDGDGKVVDADEVCDGTNPNRITVSNC